MSSADSNSIASRVSSTTRGRSQQTGRIVSIHSYRGGTGKSNISANLAYGDQLNKLIDELKLDLLPIDTHPGFDEETLLTIAISDTLLIVLRPDKQDYHGTAVLVEVGGGMAFPRVHMLGNKVVGHVDRDDIVQKIKEGYGYDVIGILPFAEEMARLGSDGIFAVRYPTHPLSKEVQGIAQRIIA